MSEWLRGARPVSDGLVVPGRPGSACGITFTPTGAELYSADMAVVLPYEDYAESDADGWTITGWAHTRGGGPIGFAVTGTGRWADPVAQLRRSCRGSRRVTDLGRRNVVPLDAAHTASIRSDDDRDALDVLCRLLARRPAWRPQLADPACTSRLLSDLDRYEHRSIEAPGGIRRRTMETLIALRRLGYVHAVKGRPLPDEHPPPADEVIRAVLDVLRANRYALPPDEGVVGGLVHRHYLGIGPWPFWALLPPDREGATTAHRGRYEPPRA